MKLSYKIAYLLTIARIRAIIKEIDTKEVSRWDD